MDKYRAIHYSDPDNGLSVTSDTVIVEDKRSEFTGLLNASGEKLYRVQETVKFGFVGKANG